MRHRSEQVEGAMSGEYGGGGVELSI